MKTLNHAEIVKALETTPAHVLRHIANERVKPAIYTMQPSPSVDAAKVAMSCVYDLDIVSACEQVENDPLALALLMQALDYDSQCRLIAYLDCL